MMRRLLILLCTTLVLTLLYQTISAQGGIDTTTNADVRLRAGPGTEWRTINIVAAGTTVRLDGQAPAGAYWVRGITPDGQIGWIGIEFLAITPEQVASLPAVWVDTPFTLPPPGAGQPPPQQPPVEPPPGVPPTATLVPQPQTAPFINSAPVRGFSFGGHVGDWSSYASDLMRGAGMTWVKRQWRYGVGQDPSAVAGWINDAHARGFRILLGIVGDRSQLYSGGYFDQYANFVGGVAGLGADAIEVWNEMNIDREWPAGSINAASYTDLLRRSYNAIKARNPNTLVISGALAPTGFFGGCSGGGCDDNLYLAGMAAAGASSYMDCIGIHYNEGILSPTSTSGDPRGSSSHYTRYFGSMMNTYYNAFGGRRSLCFTELGYLSPEGLGALPPGFEWAGNTSVAEQATWLDQAVSMAASSGRVRLLIIWNIDFAGYGSDPQAGYAIIRPGGGCPACDALRR
jgi:hypothetical protein